MDFAIWYSSSMLTILVALWLQERFRVGSLLANLVYDLLLTAWCAMMRHTGDPIYSYRAKRYR